uniref:NRF domain-containing protein n=1 Tax=Heterorhabditis bacteriophora TaxID=37862 RepID=A0A1I7WU94_HETBA
MIQGCTDHSFHNASAFLLTPTFLTNSYFLNFRICILTKVSNTFSWPESLSELTLSSISPRCKEDIETWKKALFLFTEAFSKIYVGKNTTPQLFKQLKDNYYSVKQLDAFGRPPSGFLDLTLMGFGSYKECREVDFESPYGTNYCYLSAELPFYNNTLPLKNAVCMPKSCTDQLINKRDFFLVGMNLNNNSCRSVLIFFSAWAILATIVDYVMESVYNRTYAKETNRSENSGTMTQEIWKWIIKLMFSVLRVFLSFSFWTNGAAIMNISPPKQGHLRSLDSIRFISMSWVVSGHTLIEFMLAVCYINQTEIINLLMRAQRTLMSNHPVFYRLTPPYILFLGFYVAFLPFLNGPWNISQGGLPLIQNTIQSCENTWWKNLLYINNYEPLTQCYAISWYLAVDTQLYVFAPIFLVALYFSSIVVVTFNETILGGILLSLMGIGSIVATYVIMYQYDLVATLFTLGGREEGLPPNATVEGHRKYCSQVNAFRFHLNNYIWLLGSCYRCRPSLCIRCEWLFKRNSCLEVGWVILSLHFIPFI